MTTDTVNASDVQRWDKLLSNYLEQAHWLEVQCTTEEEVDEASDKISSLEQKLWAMPAPHLTAVLTKLEIATQDCDMPPREAINEIIADLRRMSGTETSPIFQADLWLSAWGNRNGSYFVRDNQAFLCGDPTNLSLRALSRLMDRANAAETVKAMIVTCCKNMPEGPAE